MESPESIFMRQGMQGGPAFGPHCVHVREIITSDTYCVSDEQHRLVGGVTCGESGAMASVSAVRDNLFGTLGHTEGAEYQIPRKIPLRIEPKTYFGARCVLGRRPGRGLAMMGGSNPGRPWPCAGRGCDTHARTTPQPMSGHSWPG